jgi:DNA-binding beta-propeller fold protein YncE
VGSNPWDAILHDDCIYVSGLFSAKVYKMQESTGQVIGSVTVGIAPEAMAVANGKLYVCNAGNYAQNYAGSSVSVIDLASFSVIKTIPTAANPQFIQVYNGEIHVSCTGNWLDIAGSIYVIDSSLDEIIHTIPIGGAPGNLWINSEGIAYVAEGSGNSLYSYNALDYSLLNPASDPLTFAASDLTGNGTMLALLNPNWGNNAIVQLLHSDLSTWNSYTVGMMPTDIKLQNSTSPNTDHTAIPKPAQIQVYPSPLSADSSLNLKSLIRAAGEFRLYNLKGERVYTAQIQGGEHKSVDLKLPSGAYIFRFTGSEQSDTGKLLILK